MRSATLLAAPAVGVAIGLLLRALPLTRSSGATVAPTARLD